ncbi:MAG: type II toxin-antitoxin system RelE/ParE family toxin [Dehalococcoidia bacterium]
MPVGERVALDRAVDKLAAFGLQLPFPHQSNVLGSAGLRELRPRAGRSRWRALYRHSGDVFLIAAVGPEGEADPRGFDRSVASALQRLQEVEES